LVYSFFIGQVMRQLEKESSQCGVQFFLRAAESMSKQGDHFANGKFTQEFFLKQTGPGLIQEFATFGAKKSPWIEKIFLVMVFDMDHAFHLQLG
jgi:hypothetical protein